jgi:hypothetical protein
MEFQIQDKDELKRLSVLHWSASRDKYRPVLTKVLFEVTKEQAPPERTPSEPDVVRADFALTVTDSHMLVRHRRKGIILDGPLKPVKALVDAKMFGHFCAKAQPPVRIQVFEDEIRLDDQNGTSMNLRRDEDDMTFPKFDAIVEGRFDDPMVITNHIDQDKKAIPVEIIHEDADEDGSEVATERLSLSTIPLDIHRLARLLRAMGASNGVSAKSGVESVLTSHYSPVRTWAGSGGMRYVPQGFSMAGNGWETQGLLMPYIKAVS